MSIQCDYREHKCIEYLQAKNIPHEVIPLINGDFHVSHDNKAIIIERKTLDDLSCSISDGRYADQIARLSCIKSDNISILYIIEGLSKTSNKGVPYSTLLSSMQSLMIKYHFLVMRSKNHEETCEILKHISNKIKDSTSNCSSVVVKQVKKDYSHQAVYSSMLSSIPGISSKISLNIIEVYPSMSKLCDHLKENGENSLCLIPKIGKKISQTIYKYIISEES